MAMRIRFPAEPDQQLAYSVEQLASGLFLDFQDNAFKAAPAARTRPLPEGTGIYRGSYSDTLPDATTKGYPDGDYTVFIHEVGGKEQRVVIGGVLLSALVGGDDRSGMISPMEGTFVMKPKA